MATIQTGVVTQAVEASTALTANNAALENLMGVLKQFNIAAKDVQTSEFSIYPEYEQRPPRRSPQEPRAPRIVGYRVSNQVRVRVRSLPDLGKILDALVRAGSNQISGITFGIDQPTGVLNQARNRAMSDARSRADLYAQAAGVSVGRVLSISEQTAAIPRPQPTMARMAMAEASSVPVATGEQELRAVVHVVYEIAE
jgi:uncharacterized protein YggE